MRVARGGDPSWGDESAYRLWWREGEGREREVAG